MNSRQRKKREKKARELVFIDDWEAFAASQASPEDGARVPGVVEANRERFMVRAGDVTIFAKNESLR